MHEGHRQRVYNRFLTDPTSLSEVELVELMLFYSIQVRDVKPIAYRLIERFGTLRGVIEAPVEALRNVEGVGEKTVSFFKLMDMLLPTVEREERDEQFLSVNSVKNMFMDMFAGAQEEMLVVCFLDKYGGILSRSVVTNYEKSAISFNLTDIANEINRIRPDSIIIAHNHLSGNPNPSIADNMATKRIAILLNVHGVNFYDHLIFCGRDYFSYHLTGRLEKIKEEVRHTVNGNIDYNV